MEGQVERIKSRTESALREDKRRFLEKLPSGEAYDVIVMREAEALLRASDKREKARELYE